MEAWGQPMLFKRACRIEECVQEVMEEKRKRRNVKEKLHEVSRAVKSMSPRPLPHRSENLENEKMEISDDIRTRVSR